jgi:hypothetical protein
MKRHIGLLSTLGVLASAAMTSATIAQQPAPGGRGGAQQPVTMVFKEAWKDTSTMALMSQSYVTNPDLELKMYGTGKEDFSVTNEGGVPHIWTGDCASSCALALRHKDSFVDLTGKAKIRWFMKTSGFHEIRPVLKLADGTCRYPSPGSLARATLSRWERDFLPSLTLKAGRCGRFSRPS